MTIIDLNNTSGQRILVGMDNSKRVVATGTGAKITFTGTPDLSVSQTPAQVKVALDALGAPNPTLLELTQTNGTPIMVYTDDLWTVTEGGGQQTIKFRDGVTLGVQETLDEIYAASGGGGGGGAGEAMTWHNQWVQGEYEPGSVVVDDVYLMCANKLTSEKAAPVATGSPAWVGPDAPSWLTVSPETTLVMSGMRFTPPSSELMVAMRFWIPATGVNLDYHGIMKDTTDPAAPVTIFDQTIIPAATGWYEINIAGYVLLAAHTYEIILLASDDTAISQFSGSWDYNHGTANVTPSGGQMYQKDNDNLLRISVLDDNGTGRDADLDTIIVGTNIIFANGSIRQVQAVISNTGIVRDFTINNVSGTPAVGVQAIDFEVPEPQTTDYVHVVGGAVGNSVGILSKDGNPFTEDGDLYGCDIRIQDVTASADWDVMAVTAVN